MVLLKNFIALVQGRTDDSGVDPIEITEACSIKKKQCESSFIYLFFLNNHNVGFETLFFLCKIINYIYTFTYVAPRFKGPR